MSGGPIMRLNKDITEIKSVMNKNDENSCYESDGSYEVALQTTLKNINKFSALIRGPSDTPYSGGKFRINVEIPSNYPFKAPSIKFETKIYHPNINEKGEICLDILKDNWSPSMSLNRVFIAIYALLNKPNPDDPLSADIGGEYRTSYDIYKQKTIAYTKKYAIKDEHRDYMK